MKISLFVATALLLYTTSFSQNTGIGTPIPRKKMTGAGTSNTMNTPVVTDPSDFLIKSNPNEQLSYRKGHLGLGLNYIIALDGAFPGQNSPQVQGPMIGEIKLFAGNNPPYGWAFCHGQLLLEANYPTLFMIIGTTYGGDGRKNFALPDLRNAVPVGGGAGWLLGERSN